MISFLSRIMLVLSMAVMLSMPQLSYAEGDEGVVVEKPSALAMTGDLLIARPVLAAVTVVGSVIWVASLPFSLAGGNSIEAANKLIVGPAKSTFVRCLGCKNPGYKKKVEKVEGAED